MRRALLIAIFMCSFASSLCAVAQDRRPPNLEPLPEPPPPPPMSESDEPRVRIPVQPGDQVEEVRDATGRVTALKVTPPGGRPYYLIDVNGSGQWMRQDSLNPDFRVPMWPLKTFD